MPKFDRWTLLAGPAPAGSAAMTNPASAMTQAQHALRGLEQLKARRRR